MDGRRRATDEDRGVGGPSDAGPPGARPAGLCVGSGHLLIHGNAALVAAFGNSAVGVPAREGLVGLPRDAFALLDTVYREGRPLARWIRWGDEDWRLTVAPRRDVGAPDVYGVAFHLRARADVPILREAARLV